MFTEVFGNSPQTKILDFLADYPDYDYSVSEIAKRARVSRPTVYQVIAVLLQKKLIVKTREHGPSSLYKINTDSMLVRKMLKFDFEIAKMVADLEARHIEENMKKGKNVKRFTQKSAVSYLTKL